MPDGQRIFGKSNRPKGWSWGRRVKGSSAGKGGGVGQGKNGQAGQRPMFNLLCICLAKLQQGTWLMMMTLGNWQTDIRRDGLTDWLTDEVGDVTHAFLWPHKSRIAVLGFSLASHTLVPTAPRRSLCVHCARMHVCVYKCVCVCGWVHIYVCAWIE